MSILGLLCLLLALVAALILVLYGLQRRELHSIGQLSQQLLRVAAGGPIPERLDRGSDKAEIAGLVTAVNHLLRRARGGAERDAAQAPRLFTDLGDRIHEAVLLHREVILYANRQFASLIGVDRVELIGRRLADLVPPEYSELVGENIRRRLAGEPAAERYEIEMVGLQGQVSRLEISSAPVDFHPGHALLITGVEIIPTQTTPALRVAGEGAAEPQLLALQSLAEAIITTDKDGRISFLNPAAEQLTGSAASAAQGKLLEEIVSLVDETDRRLLSDPVHQALTTGAPVNLSRRALLLSRTNGSERSIELSASPIRDSDTVGRLGGDEFGTLLIGCPLDKARQIADDFTRSVGEYRFVWKDKIFNSGVSVGLVEISRESGTLEELLAAADTACYVAKKQGSGRVVVYSARDEALARHTGEIQWLQRLQGALKENRFHLYQQVIVATHAEEGGPAMEVLVRLQDEAGQELPPAEFMRAAERYRLMGLVDRWVVQATFAALGRGAISVPARRSVAINVSGQTLGDAQFLEYVVECFDTSGVAPAQVCFEINENAVIANLDHARRFVGVLHGMGCQFALDDFGSGVGSFSNLKNLPLDYLKIDGSFMRNLARDTVNQAMVAAMIKLARTLNFKVIAEQVEDAAAVDIARRMGVDYLQGYAIGRPQPLLLAA